MRFTASLPGLLVLAACGSADEQGAVAEATAAEAPVTGEGAGEMIECAIGGRVSFLRQCEVEQASFEGEKVLTVRHPDGGFRRFEVLTDGHGLATYDGFEQAVTDVVSGRLDVSVGQDRYRFPATIRGNGSSE